jgi:hypothetical protein
MRLSITTLKTGGSAGHIRFTNIPGIQRRRIGGRRLPQIIYYSITPQKVKKLHGWLNAARYSAILVYSLVQLRNNTTNKSYAGFPDLAW